MKYIMSALLLLIGITSFLDAARGGGGMRPAGGYAPRPEARPENYANPIQRTPTLSRAYPYGGYYGGGWATGGTVVEEPDYTTYPYSYPPPPNQNQNSQYQGP